MKRLILLIIMCFCLCLKTNSESSDTTWACLPFEGEASYDFLYVIGGYHSIYSGSPFPWGAVNIEDIRFIGDKMGDLVIEYTDGGKDEIPLVFGYTMWYKVYWTNYKEPFASNKELLNLLKSTLHLNEAVEGGSTYTFRVRMDSGKTIKRITLKDNPNKNGTPAIDGLYFVKGTPPKKLDGGQISVLERGSFFDSHTIDINDPYPDTIKEALDKLKSAVTVKKEELKDVKQYTFPNGYSGTRVLFSGNEFALAASNIFNYNLEELIKRVGPDGFLHESSEENYNYSYDGFGTYSYSKKGSYYNFFYSRNKAVFLLNHYGERKLAKKVMDYANNALMYFKHNKLQINGIDIPGHWTIHVNNPMAYASGSYPTQYTRERFGDDYKNIGNSENDGHGMMMLSMYNTWKNTGKSIEWIHEHFEYIKEAASWIVWNFEHPTLSFIKDDVLYSESEGANWKGHSLYCNMPCYYGLKAYADMAKAAGYEKEAEEWYSYADRLKKGILNKFVTEDGVWDTSKDGYPRDPVLFTMMYYYGFDTEDMNKDFLEISLKTYKRDINNVLECGGYYAAYGTGYDHGVITQNALLTDNMKDAAQLLENLSLVCYSPKHPNPFSVPECYAVDAKLNIVRRQGDLGNLIQMSEVLVAYNLVIGVSPFDSESKTLKILPTLPEGWSMEIHDFPIENTQGSLNLKSSIHSVELSFNNINADIKEIRYRHGPFPQGTKKIQVVVNGKKTTLDTFKSGDSSWAWLSLNPEERAFSISISNTGKKSVLDNNAVSISIPLALTAVVLSFLAIYLKLNLKGGKKVSKKLFCIVLVCALLILNQMTVLSAQKYNVAQLDGCEYSASSTFFENMNLPPEAFDGLPHTKWGSRPLSARKNQKMWTSGFR